jgi:hypothetical protein
MTGQQPGQDPNQPGWQAPMPPPPEFRPGAPAGGYGYPQQQQGPPPEVPKTLDVALWVVVANTVLGLIGVIYSLSQRDQIIARVMNNRSLSLEEARTAANIGITIGIIVGVGFALFYIFLAVKMRAGRNWARITLTVFLALGVIGGLASLGQDTAGLSKALSGIALVLDVVALVAVWQPASTKYIKARSAPTW